jgi:hypothetical protein
MDKDNKEFLVTMEKKEKFATINKKEYFATMDLKGKDYLATMKEEEYMETMDTKELTSLEKVELATMEKEDVLISNQRVAETLKMVSYFMFNFMMIFHEL